MNFSISTGPTPHAISTKSANPHGLKTWLSEYYQDFHQSHDHPQLPPERPSLPVSSTTPGRSNGMKELHVNSCSPVNILRASNARPNVRSKDEVDSAIKLDMVKSRLCPFPLLIKVEEEDRLRKIADNVRSSNEYIHAIDSFKPRPKGEKTPTEKELAKSLVPILQAILAEINPDDISHKVINHEEKSVRFHDEPPDDYTSPTYLTKPDITLVPTNTPESQMNLWKHVTTAIELKRESSEDLSSDLLDQISRYALPMIYCRPFSAVTHVMSITGNIARIYRYDAQGFCLTEGAVITDPEGFQTFCKYIAFMTHPDREKEWLRLENKVEVQGLDGSIKTYQSVNGDDFKVLFNRLRLFGSRTVCYSGPAFEISSTTGDACEDSGTDTPMQDGTMRDLEEPIQTSDIKNLKNLMIVNIVIKLTWVADKLHRHELDVLVHMHSHKEFSHCLSRFKVPRPLGTLSQIDRHIETACDIPVSRPKHPREKPLRFVSLVTECPVGTLIQDSQVLELVSVFKNLAQILLDTAKAGVQYRDFNLGNILQTGKGDSSDCLLIDFGNARFENKPRGKAQDGKTVELALDDYRSCTEAFCSIASLELTTHAETLFDMQRRLNEGMLARVPQLGHIEAEITELENELPSKILHHFDDLQSAFFCFVYVLGIKSRRKHAFPTSLRAKGTFLRAAIFSIGWFQFAPSVHEVISSLASKLAQIVHPQNRLAVVEQSESAKDQSCLTKAEEEYFAQWINTCDEAIVSLKSFDS